MFCKACSETNKTICRIMTLQTISYEMIKICPKRPKKPNAKKQTLSK